MRYIRKFEGRSEPPMIEKIGESFLFRYGPGSQYMITKDSYDVPTKLAAMDKAGVDMAVLSINVPGAETLSVSEGNDLARMVNDEYAEVVAAHPDRFLALTTLPYRDTDAALKELDRASTELGFRGIMFWSNIGGMPVSDESLWPIYEMAEALDQPIVIHPTRPVMADELREYGLEIVVGFMFDTSLAALKLIFSGVMERYPKLKFVLPHAGSTLPYLCGRIDYQSRIIPGSWKNLTALPSEYIKRLYTDTVCLSKPTLKLAFDFFGCDKVLFGTDFPYWEMEPSVSLVEEMDVSEEERSLIFQGNAERILKIVSDV